MSEVAKSQRGESQPQSGPGDEPTLNHGLPAAAYVDQAFFDRECSDLFSKTWMFVGFAHELPAAGDAVPVRVGEHPILLVNRGGGEIKAFHNVCRHRGTVLVDKPSNVGRYICCPYHSWTYDLDGALCQTPHFGGPDIETPAGFRPQEFGLRPVRCSVWHDWIFINIDGTALDFATYSAALQARLKDVGLEAAHPIAMIDLGEIKSNWKFLMENFIEPYHVQFVHRSTTRQPLINHSTFVDGFCIGCSVDLSRRPRATGTSKRLDVNSRYLTLFPNFVLGWYEPDQLGVHLNVPLAPGLTYQRRAIYHIGSEDLSDERVDRLTELWRNVHREDHEICERLQAGRDSTVTADGGVLSPHWEIGVRRFQELVLQSIGADSLLSSARG